MTLQGLALLWHCIRYEAPSCSLYNSEQKRGCFIGTLAVLKFSFNPVTLKFLSICVCERAKRESYRRELTFPRDSSCFRLLFIPKFFLHFILYFLLQAKVLSSSFLTKFKGWNYNDNHCPLDLKRFIQCLKGKCRNFHELPPLLFDTGPFC